ncbi:MAG: hypothetical protein Kow0098_22120 [Ignavibacteriaceae bacterium]
MDLILFISGILQLFLGLIIGVAFIYFAFRVFRKMTRGIDDISELKKKNVSVAILDSSVIFAIILAVKNSIDPAITTFVNEIKDPASTTAAYFQTAAIMALQIIIAGIIGFISIYLAMKLFMWLSREIDELEEIKNDNRAIAILMAVVIISVALLIQPAIGTILDSLVPFPEVSFRDIGH